MAILDTVAATAPDQEDPLLAQIVERLVDSYHPEQIYLFGSVARGDATLDSDYDLMIVVPNHAAPNQCHPDLAYRAVRGLERSGDFLVWTREAFQKRLHIKSSLPATCRRAALAGRRSVSLPAGSGKVLEGVSDIPQSGFLQDS